MKMIKLIKIYDHLIAESEKSVNDFAFHLDLT